MNFAGSTGARARQPGPFRLPLRSCSAGILLCAIPPAHAAVTISSAATQNMNCVAGVCTPTAANAVLNVNDLTTMLGSGNTTVNTGSGSLAQQVDDIIVAAGFNWTSASSLTLDAYRSVTVNQAVADNGSGAVSLVTNDGGSGGVLSFGPTGNLSFLGTTNSLVINGTSYTLENTLTALAAAIASNPAGAYALASSYNASHDGTYSQSPVPTTFTGTFEGLGNTVSHITLQNRGKRNEVGGLFAETSAATVENIGVVSISVNANGALLAGGLVGLNYGGSLIGIHSGGKVDGGENIGGLVGENLSAGFIFNSYAETDVDGHRGLGGLVGSNGGVISSCYATGKVKGDHGFEAAGLVGNNGSQIINSYATGSAVGGPSAEVGGLVADNEAYVSTSYSTGNVSAGSRGTVGGLVGLNDVNLGITGSYWDTKTSGTDVGIGAGSTSGATGLTTKQFKAGLPSGFDPTIWAQSPSINKGFPYLLANPPQ
jgi:hypothetical protein